ncbi:MAG: cobalt ECF transporter T component CbiQ, partial [Anaerolineae bacterium]|nr:cobalt ECF transporter T component CbiQ [Anaerolineae bacterium]
MSLSQNLDPYLPGSSLVHRLDPRVKVGWALGFILTVALTPPAAWPVGILLVAIAAAVAILAEMPAGIVLRRAAMATPFALS